MCKDLLENAFEILLFYNEIQESAAGECMGPVDLGQKVIFRLTEDQLLRSEQLQRTVYFSQSGERSQKGKQK